MSISYDDRQPSLAASIYTSGDDPTDPAISPMFDDLKGLPRTLIQMGTPDLLLWDCRKFYQKCLDAGVNVTYEAKMLNCEIYILFEWQEKGRFPGKKGLIQWPLSS